MAFRKDFLWGAASAAYQLEGGYKEDGKGMNVWDVYTNCFSAKTEKFVKYCETGNEACDHYHRFKEDTSFPGDGFKRLPADYGVSAGSR